MCYSKTRPAEHELGKRAHFAHGGDQPKLGRISESGDGSLTAIPAMFYRLANFDGKPFLTGVLPQKSS